MPSLRSHALDGADAERLTPARRPDTPEWSAVRAVVLARDERRCRSCGEQCASGEADVHHLVPRAAGGADEPANLITLCDGCHAVRHPNLHGTLARRTIERWGMRFARWLDHRQDLATLDASLGATLRLLGATRFRPHQLDVVLAALNGESLLMVSATGSGKSLCFQVPILLRRGCGFVISPLKALMNQQVADLQSRKIPGTFINGDLSPQEKEIRYQLLRDHAVKFLYCTPERFDAGMVHPAEVQEMSRARPNFLVVDEAHCIDRWGRDFRPNYGRLRDVRRALGDPPVLAFTATAGLQSQRRILQSLGIPDARVVVTGVDRPNIAMARLDGVADERRYRLIIELLRRMPAGHAILFVPTIKEGQRLQQGVRELGVDVPFFHSRLGTANDRDMLLGQFTGRLEPPVSAIICTNAFGMGLNVSDVRLVVHWQPPASVEDYLQEFGRAGRDGAPAVAVLFTGARDAGLLTFMAEQTVSASRLDTADKALALDARRAAITEMTRCATARQLCFRRAIIAYFGAGEASGRKSLAVKLVERIFSRPTHVDRVPGCCDRCDDVHQHNVLRWATGIWGNGEQRDRTFTSGVQFRLRGLLQRG